MIPLIIDTDVALGVHHDGRPRDIDDAFAIAEALNSDDLDLKLVSTVFGNAPLVDVHRVALEVMALKGSDTPVAKGAAEAMAADTPTNAAVEAMAAVLTEGPCAVAAIGPLTNMGLLALHHPDAYANISKLLIVAGRTVGHEFMIGGHGPVADFNFEQDPFSAEIALSRASPDTEIVMAGFELTSQVCVTEHDLETIKDRGTSTATYFYENSLAWCRYWTKTFPTDDGFHPWDSATICFLKHPDYFATEPRGWEIQEKGGKPQLATSTSLGGNVTYCTGFTAGGAEAFVRDVVEHVY